MKIEILNMIEEDQSTNSCTSYLTNNIDKYNQLAMLFSYLDSEFIEEYNTEYKYCVKIFTNDVINDYI